MFLPVVEICLEMHGNSKSFSWISDNASHARADGDVRGFNLSLGFIELK